MIYFPILIYTIICINNCFGMDNKNNLWSFISLKNEFLFISEVGETKLKKAGCTVCVLKTTASALSAFNWFILNDSLEIMLQVIRFFTHPC